MCAFNVIKQISKSYCLAYFKHFNEICSELLSNLSEHLNKKLYMLKMIKLRNKIEYIHRKLMFKNSIINTQIDFKKERDLKSNLTCNLSETNAITYDVKVMT